MMNVPLNPLESSDAVIHGCVPWSIVGSKVESPCVGIYGEKLKLRREFFHLNLTQDTETIIYRHKDHFP
jgi:hypothetical protein